jgi:FkbM family methyltransferase
MVESAGFPNKQVTFGGHRFRLHGIAVDDAYWQAIGDDFEIEFLNLCRQFIRPDYVCVDVGANIGAKSLFLSRHCYNGKVIAIEPAPHVADCLTTNVYANNASNVIIERTAVGEHTGTTAFVERSAWSHLRIPGVPYKQSIIVPITILDDIITRHALSRLDFIKLDVEGAEFPILKNSLELINRFGSLIYVELNAFAQLAVTNNNPRAFIDWLMDNFTHVFAISRTGTGSLLQRYGKSEWLDLLRRNIIFDRCATDLLATNAERRLVLSQV